MSICSDIFITEEEARKKVKAFLLYEQELLVDAAVKGMQDFELSSYLNKDNEVYYYNITKTKKAKREK